MSSLKLENNCRYFDEASYICLALCDDALCSRMLRYRMAGITESAMVAYTHKYAVV